MASLLEQYDDEKRNYKKLGRLNTEFKDFLNVMVQQNQSRYQCLLNYDFEFNINFLVVLYGLSQSKTNVHVLHEWPLITALFKFLNLRFLLLHE